MMSFKLSLGKIGINTVPMFTNEAIAAFILNTDTIVPEYLCRALKQINLAESADRAAMGQTLNKAKLSKLEIPLPSLPEQKRIADILDKADALREKRKKSIAKLDALLQSVFVDMFGDPVTNPKGWDRCILDDFVVAGDKINYGVVQPGDDLERGCPMVRVGDVQMRNTEPSQMKQIDPDIENQYSRSRLVGNEVLISCVGTIGKTLLVTAGLVGVNIARAVARVPVDSSRAERVFVSACIEAKGTQDYFLKETRTVSQPTLNIKQIKTAPMIFPPLSEQKRFVHAVALLSKTAF